MGYKRSDMVYKDYEWTAKDDHDNPQIRGGTDHSELNRTEGFEMLYFIDKLVAKWGWKVIMIASYQRLERIIKNDVPSNIRTHGKIQAWIEARYPNIKEQKFLT